MFTHLLWNSEYFACQSFINQMDGDSCRWTPKLEIWLTRITAGWRDRRIITSTLASLVYYSVKHQCSSPLLGCYPPVFHKGIKRALNLANLFPYNCFVQDDNSKIINQFGMGELAIKEYFDEDNTNCGRARWLAAMDAASYKHTGTAKDGADVAAKNNSNFSFARDRASQCRRLMTQACNQTVLVEGHNYLRLAQAHSAFDFGRFYDCLTHVVNLLCDYEEAKIVASFPAPQPDPAYGDNKNNNSSGHNSSSTTFSTINLAELVARDDPVPSSSAAAAAFTTVDEATFQNSDEEAKRRRVTVHRKCIIEMLPIMYLLLVQVLTKLYAHPRTIYLAFRQARCAADNLQCPPGSSTPSSPLSSSSPSYQPPVFQNHFGTVPHLLDGDFAYTNLIILNSQGLLSCAANFFHMVITDNKIFLKQSALFFRFCVEYVQNSAFPYIENLFAYMCGHQHFHSICQHPQYPVPDPQDLLTQQLLQISQTLCEITDLCQTMQRWIKSGNANHTCTSHLMWNSSWGTDLQQNSTDFLLFKCKVNDWMVKYASRFNQNVAAASQKQDSTQASAVHFVTTKKPKDILLSEYNTLMDNCTKMLEIMPSDHPFWPELTRLEAVLDTCWEPVHDPSENVKLRAQCWKAISRDKILENLKMLEAQTGTSNSVAVGDAAFQGFVYTSVFLCFSGPYGRNQMCTDEIAKLAEVNYAHATRNAHYRLPVLKFLRNINPKNASDGAVTLAEQEQFLSKLCQKNYQGIVIFDTPPSEIYPHWRQNVNEIKASAKFYSKLSAEEQLEKELAAEPTYNKNRENEEKEEEERDYEDDDAQSKENKEDDTEYLTLMQATIEKGFRVPVSGIKLTLEQQRTIMEDWIFTGLLNMTKNGGLPWDLFSATLHTKPTVSNIRNFVAGATSPHSVTPLEFVVNNLFKNHLDKEMIGAALHFASNNSISAFRFDEVLSHSEAGCKNIRHRDESGDESSDDSGIAHQQKKNKC